MATDNTDLIAKFEAKMNSAFGRMFKFIGKIKNQVTLKLASGEDVYVEPASPDAPNELKGGKIYLVDETGMPTTNAPADGEVALEDGRVLVIAGGVITEVKQAADASKLEEEVAALKTQLEEKEAAIAAMTKSNEQAIEAVKIEAKKHADEIQAAFNEFKKAIPGEPKAKKDENQEHVDMSKMTTAQRVRAMSKARQKEMN